MAQQTTLNPLILSVYYHINQCNYRNPIEIIEALGKAIDQQIYHTYKPDQAKKWFLKWWEKRDVLVIKDGGSEHKFVREGFWRKWKYLGPSKP